MLSDNQKIGIGFMCLGFSFIFLGIVLFFDASLIAIGNILFLVGLSFSIGIAKTIQLFLQPSKLRGTVLFFLGMALVIMRWGVIGMCVEFFGFLNLFGNFLPTALTMARNVPIIGNVLNTRGVSEVVDFLAGRTKPKNWA